MKIKIFISLFFSLISSFAAWAGQGNPNPQVIPPHAYPFGMSYGEWSAEWWKWQLALPGTDHPAFSITGADCAVGQEGKVWFLTGAFTTEAAGSEFNTIVRESCSIPTGKAIFFPLVNVECSTVEAEPFRLIEEGPDQNADICAEKFVDGPFAVLSDLSATIDGTSLENVEAYRFQSPLFSFSFDDPSDNVIGVDCSIEDCDNMSSVSDGYWVMLPPLSRGEHTINFTGSFRDPVTDELFFGLDVTYELTVRGGRK